MSKFITRTFIDYKIEVIDGKTGEIKSSYTQSKKPVEKKIAIKYIKETGSTNFATRVTELETMREMTVEDFVKYSKVVEPKKTLENTHETEGEKA